MKFQIPITLPLSQQQVCYSEMTNHHLMCLLKYMTINDNNIIAMMFDDLITELTQLDAHNMFAVDKFVLLMDMRSIFWNNQIEFQPKSRNRVRMTISSIIDNLRNTIDVDKLTSVVCCDNIKITMSMPRKFVVNTDDIIHQTIHSIDDSEDVHNYALFSAQQQQQFIESLPADVYVRMTQELNKFQQHLDQGCLIQENINMGIERYPVDVTGVHLFELLKSMFADDLLGLYELQYNLTTKMHVSHQQFMQMTPNETKIYIHSFITYRWTSRWCTLK